MPGRDRADQSPRATARRAALDPDRRHRRVRVGAARRALLAGEIDVAVHSYKDLPTAPADGIALAAVPPREDPRDALVARDGLTLGELPHRCPGRHRLAAARRPAARARPRPRGRAAARQRRHPAAARSPTASSTPSCSPTPGCAASAAPSEVTEILDPIQVLPAPAQGALAIECRGDDAATLAVLAALDHADTRAAVDGRAGPAGRPRGRVHRPGRRAGRDLPRATTARREIFLRGSVTAIDGSDAVRLSATGPTTDADGDRPAACRRPARRRRRHHDGELVHDPRTQARRPDHLRRCRPGRPRTADDHAVEAIRAAEVRRRRRRRCRRRSPTSRRRRGRARPRRSPADVGQGAARRGAQRARRSSGSSPATRSPTTARSRRRWPSRKTVVPFDVVPGRQRSAPAPPPTPASRSARCAPRPTSTDVDRRRLRRARARARHARAHRRGRRRRVTSASSSSPTASSPTPPVTVSCDGTDTGQQTVRRPRSASSTWPRSA